MTFLRSLTTGLRRLVRPSVAERELDDELRHYIEMATQERIRGGAPPHAAHRAALLEVGGMESTKERVRAGGWESFVGTFWHDVRYGARALRRNPGFALAAILTLAIGIGANTTIFSLINAILLRPPPHVRAPERLVSVFTSDYSGPAYGSSSYPDYEEFARQTAVFDGVILYTILPVGIGEGDDLERAGMEIVSAGYFEILGVQPSHGRSFLAEETRTGSQATVAVISHSLWQRRFASDPSVVGQTIRLNGRAVSIVGVAPAGFAGSLRGVVIDVWAPVASASLLGAEEGISNRGNRSFFLTARLKEGVTLADAKSAMGILAAQLFKSYPEAWRDVSEAGRRITLVPEKDSRVPPFLRGPVLGFMALLMATAVLVLLICCANVASLTLARATRRAREIGVRLSLGASRARVIRLLLTEGVLIALLGGALGTAFALWVTRAIMTFRPPLPVSVSLELRLDPAVLLFTLGAALATALVFGLVPAMRASRPHLVGMLKGDAGTATVAGRRISLQSALVVTQMAVSMLLLAGALLFVRSLRSAAAIDVGFTPGNLLLVDIAPRPGPGTESINQAQVAERVVARLAALPGVTGASWASTAPLGFDASRRGTTIEGYRPAQGEDMEYHYNHVGPAYFETMRIPMAGGRGFSAADRAGAPGVVVVNEAFARRFWPGQSALGRRLSVRGEGGPWMEVVGVTRTGKYLSLTETDRPFMFFPSLQEPRAGTVILRTSTPPRTLQAGVDRELKAEAPEWLATGVRTMEEQIGTSLLPQRVAGTVLSLFGVVALTLAAVGLYGVVAYSVASRAREIGVRIALGARRQDVIRQVLRQGTVLVGIGVAIGLPLAWGVARLIAGFLIGAGGWNVVALGGAALLLTGAALLASWLPARRAAGVSPMISLRNE